MVVLSSNTCPPQGPLKINEKHYLFDRATNIVSLQSPTAGGYVDYRTGVTFKPYGGVVEGPQSSSRYGLGYTSNNDANYALYNPESNISLVINRGTFLAVVTSVDEGNFASSNSQLSDYGWNLGLKSWSTTLCKVRLTLYGVQTVEIGAYFDKYNPCVFLFRFEEGNFVDFFYSSDYLERAKFETRSLLFGRTTNNKGIVLVGQNRFGSYVPDKGVLSSMALAIWFEDHLLSDGECWDLVYDPWLLFRPHREVVSFYIQQGLGFNVVDGINFSDDLSKLRNRNKIIFDGTVVNESNNKHFVKNKFDKFLLKDDYISVKKTTITSVDIIKIIEKRIFDLYKVTKDSVLLGELISYATGPVNKLSEQIIFSDVVKTKTATGFGDNLILNENILYSLIKTNKEKLILQEILSIIKRYFIKEGIILSEKISITRKALKLLEKVILSDEFLLRLFKTEFNFIEKLSLKEDFYKWVIYNGRRSIKTTIYDKFGFSGKIKDISGTKGSISDIF